MGNVGATVCKRLWAWFARFGAAWRCCVVGSNLTICDFRFVQVASLDAEEFNAAFEPTGVKARMIERAEALYGPIPQTDKTVHKGTKMKRRAMAVKSGSEDESSAAAVDSDSSSPKDKSKLRWMQAPDPDVWFSPRNLSEAKAERGILRDPSKSPSNRGGIRFNEDSFLPGGPPDQ
eukprot:GHVU01122180.1.p1 GENE.GHVU01122180.1~~GHVU01122180.1.p1  ORF type:complete len:176 (+),score=20.34 GHVU01122180.1:2642-3169(+)